MSFVGINQQALTSEALIQLLEKLETTATSYYFLRWTHRVSGIWGRRLGYASLVEDICDRLTTHPVSKSQPLEVFPSPEGQMFNSHLELRWKQKKANYEVLLLSAAGSQQDYPEFQPVGSNWQVVERGASLYASGSTQTETRFPKEFDYRDIKQDIKLAQRYFQDSQTATVHFVALTVSSKND